MSRFLSILIANLFFLRAAFGAVDSTVLTEETLKRFSRVPEFDFIMQEAQKLGVKVYLFGGTASAFAHYVRWDLEREAGDDKYQPERFDYDFTNIYRGNQDLDIVVDGPTPKANQLRTTLQAQYPHFVGEKEAWEVRLLREAQGDKRALLGDEDFKKQHTDSNSTGMLDLTASPGEIVYRDLFNWEDPQSQFLKDVSQGKVTFYYSDQHEETQRFIDGKNPPFLSVIRYVAKLTQYEVEGSAEDLEIIKKMMMSFDHGRYLNDYTTNKAIEFGTKALLNAPDVEYAWDLLEETGLRDFLQKADGKSKGKMNSLSWWLNKEPLRSFELGQGSGKTAEELGIDVVAHETQSFKAYENITRSSTGRANVFISRENYSGEAAVYGNGFYTQIGREGARGTGITIRFKLHPQARQGTDFTLHGKYVVVLNKNALELIQENIDLSLLNYFKLTASGQINSNDKGLIAKLERRFLRKKIEPEEVKEIAEYLKNAPKKGDLSYMFELWMSISGSENYPELLESIFNRVGKNDKLAVQIVKETFKDKRWKSLRMPFLKKIVFSGNESAKSALVNFMQKSKSLEFTEQDNEEIYNYFVEMNYVSAGILRTFSQSRFWFEKPDYMMDVVNKYHLDENLVSIIISQEGMSKVALPVVERLLEKGNSDEELIKDVFSKEEWVAHPEFIQEFINESVYSNELSEHIFSKPYWFLQIDLLNFFIEQGLGKNILAKIFKHNEWKGETSTILKYIPRLTVKDPSQNYGGDSGTHQMVKLLEERPNWPKSPKVILALLAKKDRTALGPLFKLIQQPGWEEYPEVFEAFIGKIQLRELLDVLSRDPWSKHKYLVDKIILDSKSDLRTVTALMAKESFVGRSELFINFLYARKDELRKAINTGRSFGNASTYLSYLVEQMFKNKGWEKYPEVIEAIFSMRDPFTEQVLIRQVFSKEEWSVDFIQPYINYFVETGNKDHMSLIIDNILTRSDWPHKEEMLQSFIAYDLQSLNFRIIKRLFEGYWPDQIHILTDFLERKDAQLEERIAEYLVSYETYAEYQDIIKKLVSRSVFTKDFGKVIFSDLFKKERVEWVEQYLKNGRMDDQIAKYALSQDFALKHPEWLVHMVSKMNTEIDGVLLKYVFSEKEWTDHPVLQEYLYGGYKDGHKVTLQNLRDFLFEKPFNKWFEDYSSQKRASFVCKDVL